MQLATHPKPIRRRILSSWHAVAALLMLLTLRGTTSGAPVPHYDKLVLSEEFFSEGATFGDINGDRHPDVVSGPYWYAGPNFEQRYTYTSVQRYPIVQYSKHFFSWTYDFNQDGHRDILVVGFPGQAAAWYENPGVSHATITQTTSWKQHEVLDRVDHESPAWEDITGDGVPELVCAHDGALGYASPGADCRQPWQFIPCTQNRTFVTFSHGLGIGDVNGDGRKDLLEPAGWWEQPAELGKPFLFHEVRFAEPGGSQMFAYDLDGDGDQDVISVQQAHGWGLTWFERRGTGADMLFVPHPILVDPNANPPNAAGEPPSVPGIQLSQMHALGLHDMDGDGIRDLVTGKRYWAHGERDPGSLQLPALLWFRTQRIAGRVEFEPHWIDLRSGVGTQITIEEMNGDQHPDLVVGSKLGTFVLLSVPPDTPSTSQQVTTELDLVRLQTTGTPLFDQQVRTTEPLDAEQERRTFLLPTGFRAELVACEPQIAKPLNMAFDSRGRLWVTSSVEYPFPAAADQPARDTIKILEDTDADGRTDKITTFAEGLNIPIGLYPYQDGVICFSIPNILWLRDTDHDGRADSRQVLYGPFDTSRDTHGMCNAFKRGLDGWLYACHGFNNQSSVAGHDGHRIEMHSGNVFRMRLDGSRLEHFTHGQVNPFGLTFDRWGDLLSADCHTKPISLLMPGGCYPSFGKPHDGLGFVPDVMSHLHGSTGVGGIALGEATHFPQVYRSSSFGGNVVTSRINRNTLRWAGGSLHADEEADFLVSGDPWFRPVDLQVGPDGALYVADFYNRIIGHYEVPLKHPGRDRERGRIWRIVYDDPQFRRDESSGSWQSQVNLERLSLAQLLTELRTESSDHAQRIIEQIVARFDAEAIPLARERLANDGTASVRGYALWLLFRLQALQETDLTVAWQDQEPFVRCQAYRVLLADPARQVRWLDALEAGFQDPAPRVQRWAVLAAAASENPADQLASALTQLYRRTPAQDVHLQHAIRIALRRHLQSPGAFSRWVAATDPNDTPLVARMALGLKSTEAADELAIRFENLRQHAEIDWGECLTFVARYVSEGKVDHLIGEAERLAQTDLERQIGWLGFVRQGALQRGQTIPTPVVAWAERVVSTLLHDDMTTTRAAEPIMWHYEADPATPQAGNPWSNTDTHDFGLPGVASAEFYSTFPQGEASVGLYRSEPFTATHELKFHIAGQDGYPGQPATGRNLVRLRHAKRHDILLQSGAPRQDLAQAVIWDTATWLGEPVYVELVDGNREAAYAWMAVGHFSEQRLNPSLRHAQRRSAARLIAEFHLLSFRSVLCDILQRPHLDVQLGSDLALALADLDGDRWTAVLAESLLLTGAPPEWRTAAVASIVTRDSSNRQQLVDQAMRLATSQEQLRMAERLVAYRDGIDLLLTAMEAGHASPLLLRRPTIHQKLEAIAGSEQKSRTDRLMEQLPAEDERIASILADRRANFLTHGGNRDAGQPLFQKNCMGCHQVAGQGKRYGPNLDGIGSRALDRLMEDVLAPHRNVDSAFRSQTIILHDGRVLSGLVVPTSDQQITLVHGAGEETIIAVRDIESRVASPLSPMPGNFSETLTEQQTNDLWAYLMSLRN